MCVLSTGSALRAVVAMATVGVAAVVQAGTSNSLMDISSDGRWLACSNRDSGTVTIVDLDLHQKQYEIDIGDQPEGVTFLGATHRLAVAVYGADKIVVIDADTGETTGITEVFDEPYGIVSNASGSRLFATLDHPGHVVEIDTSSHDVLRTIEAGQFLRGIAISPSNDRLFVTEFYSSHVKAIDVRSGQVIDQWTGASTDNLARQIVPHPRRPKAYLPHIRSRVTAVHGAGSIFPYLSIVDTIDSDGKRRKRIPLDAVFGNLITSNPWEVAVSRDGRQLYVVFGGTNDMFACDVIDDDYREIGFRRRLVLGANPRAVRVAPDGKTVFVYNALDFNVVAYDTETLSSIAEISVTDNPLGEQLLEGKRLFYSALQPMSGSRWIACSSCHPDGQPDGRTWHNPEGLRNTQSLAAMAWTHPIHWSADRDEVQDFEHTIRGPLMQGRGLMQGQVQESLAEPNLRRSTQLDALAAYTNSHKVSLSPYARHGLSTAARRGREIFFSDQTKCASCHSGPFYSDSRPASPDQIVRHDVGTGHDPSEKMGPAYDTPTLLGVYRTAPYLHHGKAKTLLEVLTTENPHDQHGVTSQLSDEETKALVEFLKSLPYEDPELAARKLGMTKTEQ